MSFTLVSIFFTPCLANLCKDSSKNEVIERPEIEDGSYIENIVEVEINKKSEEVNIWFDNLAPEKIIRGTGAVSGIESTCMLTKEPWGKIGSRRLVYKESGSTFVEEVLENNPKKYFHYEMWDFSKDVAHAIKYANGYFKVIEVNESKSILRWYVGFKPSSFIYKLPLMLYVKGSFAPFMKKSIEAIKAEVEK